MNNLLVKVSAKIASIKDEEIALRHSTIAELETELATEKARVVELGTYIEAMKEHGQCWSSFDQWKTDRYK